MQLGYWKIRGLAEPIRLLLEYCQVKYENVTYEVGPAPEYNRDCWFGVKHTLGLGPFANLPYLKDGDVVIVQSTAILNYLSRKFSSFNLDGETEEAKQRCDVTYFQALDVFVSGFTSMCYNKEFVKMKVKFLEALPGKLDHFASYLGERKFFAGDKVTKCDFIMFEMLSRMKVFEPRSLDKFPTLVEYLNRFSNIPQIKAYLESDRFQARPINNVSANWY